MSEKYATVTEFGGMGFREIAENMNQLGFKMNHSTARNVFHRGMEKMAKHIIQELDLEADASNAAQNAHFQTEIYNLLCEVLDN